MISDKQSLVPIILEKVITPFPNNVKSFALLSQVENISQEWTPHRIHTEKTQKLQFRPHRPQLAT